VRSSPPTIEGGKENQYKVLRPACVNVIKKEDTQFMKEKAQKLAAPELSGQMCVEFCAEQLCAETGGPKGDVRCHYDCRRRAESRQGKKKKTKRTPRIHGVEWHLKAEGGCAGGGGNRPVTGAPPGRNIGAKSPTRNGKTPYFPQVGTISIRLTEKKHDQ